MFYVLCIRSGLLIATSAVPHWGSLSVLVHLSTIYVDHQYFTYSKQWHERNLNALKRRPIDLVF